jgi:hypothetical protein
MGVFQQPAKEPWPESEDLDPNQGKLKNEENQKTKIYNA